MTPVEDARAAVRLALQKLGRCEADLKRALGELTQQKINLEDVLAVLAESESEAPPHV